VKVVRGELQDERETEELFEMSAAMTPENLSLKVSDQGLVLFLSFDQPVSAGRNNCETGSQNIVDQQIRRNIVAVASRVGADSIRFEEANLIKPT
jgi:hypothetical protein